MPITDRNLLPGTTLVATYKKQGYSCCVEAGEEGRLVFRLPDGRTFKTISGAGHAVTQKSCNGWDFWTLEGDKPVKPAEKPKPEATAKKKPLFKQVRKLPRTAKTPESEDRWHCAGCMRGFSVAAGTLPETCPEGHAREEADEIPMA